MTTLPLLTQRPLLSDSRKRLRPKTYSVAVYLVFAVVTLQMVMLISVFWLRAMVVSVNVNVPKARAGVGGAPYIPQPIRLHAIPSDIDSIGVRRLPSLTTAVTLKVPAANDKLAQIQTLNEEAQVFLRQNDYSSAVDLLVKAEDLDPRNPSTLKNLAETYNLTNDPVMSQIYWQRIVDLGEGVGTIYGVAVDHVLLADSGHESNPLKEPSSLARVVYVNAVEKSPVETRDGAAHFELRVSLKHRDPKMVNFDQKKLQPYVIFYQQMPDGSLAPDLSQRKGSFEDTFLFEKGKETEPFTLNYVMPVPGAPGPNNTKQGEYYGFVIGLYYDKTLQDVRSEPTDLSTRMALPQEIE